MSAPSNRKNKIGVFLGLALGLIVLCVAVSSLTSHLLSSEEGWTRHDDADGHHWLHRELDLTPEEAARIDEFEPAYRQERAELQRQFQAKVQELKKEITTSDEFTPQTDQLIHELHIIHGQLQELSIRHYFQMMQVLPEEKQVRLQDLAAKALSVPQ
ncbi:periplasmic heavy metal sensor [Puniceicoccus vermicola]|uniref:Periplasmic heavy metal sensor n=1 Tax=Puniceicoccus vermicola TaxID=388746 RepID=A0A7X1B1E8_9BACT|nr:periplasmic heavy metal sensor [Puniceicoccus vermicola]MBC2603841.1 periplasmic heavy metal sensor [Puniceicoccus vermicola]